MTASAVMTRVDIPGPARPRADRLLARLVRFTGRGSAIGVGQVELDGQITPDTCCVRYEVSMRQVRRGRLVLGVADGRVFADDKGVYLAKDIRVGLTLAM